jgi:hypothetical protein
MQSIMQADGCTNSLDVNASFMRASLGQQMHMFDAAVQLQVQHVPPLPAHP